ncbi:MAG: SPOR domain-containing protein, partial [Thiobacillus sp.]|nr:SPOR domain-containing protein [Thiobacillus sp.]
MLIGLTVGAVLAVGVALWATGNNPFRASAPTAPPAPATPDAPETAPSFDFYKVLPSDAPDELPPADKPVAPVPRYYLQAG